MRKRFLATILVLLLSLWVYAGDKISFLELSVGATAVPVYLRHSAEREVTIINDHATQYLIIDWDGTIPTSLDLADGATTADSAALTSATATFVTNGVEKGDLVWLHEGTADDGVYEIVSVDSETQITLCQALTVTDADVDFDVQDWRIKAGESQTYELHGSQFSIKASGASTGVRIYIKSEVNW